MRDVAAIGASKDQAVVTGRNGAYRSELQNLGGDFY